MLLEDYFFYGLKVYLMFEKLVDIFLLGVSVLSVEFVGLLNFFYVFV